MQTAIRQGIDKNFAAQRRKPGVRWRTRVSFCAYAALFVALISTTACITAPPKKQTAVEKAREETAYGAELARQFDPTIHLHGDPVVEKYLNRVAMNMAIPSADPRLVDTKVAIVLDRGGQWRTYSLPGKKVYFSLGLLQQLHYDNEVAAAIALEYGNLVQGNVLRHLKMEQQGVKSFLEVDPAIKLVTPPKVDFYGTEGVFAFDIDEVKLAIKSAIEIMYKGGYDIRGLLEIWSIFQKNPQHSPFPDRVLEELVEYTRAVISKYAPMRNPVVRTEEFKAVQMRIKSL